MEKQAIKEKKRVKTIIDMALDFGCSNEDLSYTTAKGSKLQKPDRNRTIQQNTLTRQNKQGCSRERSSFLILEKQGIFLST